MQLPGAGPLIPDADSEPMREYVNMPKHVLDNIDQFILWVERSAGYVRRKAALG
jgi:hypothetical protein